MIKWMLRMTTKLSTKLPWHKRQRIHMLRVSGTVRKGSKTTIYRHHFLFRCSLLPHSLTNELLPFMPPWNIVYISKLRRYCIRPGASSRISTSQWAFHNLARPRVVCVGTGHQGHVHIYIDQGYAVTPLPQLQIQLYLYPWDGWDWCLVPFFQDSKIDIQTHNQHEPRTQSK